MRSLLTRSKSQESNEFYELAETIIDNFVIKQAQVALKSIREDYSLAKKELAKQLSKKFPLGTASNANFIKTCNNIFNKEKACEKINFKKDLITNIGISKIANTSLIKKIVNTILHEYQKKVTQNTIQDKLSNISEVYKTTTSKLDVNESEEKISALEFFKAEKSRKSLKLPHLNSSTKSMLTTSIALPESLDMTPVSKSLSESGASISHLSLSSSEEEISDEFERSRTTSESYGESNSDMHFSTTTTLTITTLAPKASPIPSFTTTIPSSIEENDSSLSLQSSTSSDSRRDSLIASEVSSTSTVTATTPTSFNLSHILSSSSSPVIASSSSKEEIKDKLGDSNKTSRSGINSEDKTNIPGKLVIPIPFQTLSNPGAQKSSIAASENETRRSISIAPKGVNVMSSELMEKILKRTSFSSHQDKILGDREKEKTLDGQKKP